MIGRQEASEGANATGNKPFFSIIIPVYNVAPYLRECLDSVLAQTFHNWEAICVDDGSADGSGAILDEYAAKDKRFMVIHKKNEGVSVARNAALDDATGNYIIFVDADDVILCDWLKVFYEVINKEKCDVVRGRFRYWQGDAEYLHCNETKYSTLAKYSGQREVCSWGVPEMLCAGYSFLNCIRRDAIIGLRFPAGIRLMEDSIFCAYAMVKATSATVIDYTGYLYREREDSATHKHGERQSIVLDLYDQFQVLGCFWAYCRKRIDDDVSLKAIQKAITGFVFWHTMNSGVANRRNVVDKATDFRRLAEGIKALYSAGAMDMSKLGKMERIALWLYIMTSCWYSVLVLWKIKAGIRKVRRRLIL